MGAPGAIGESPVILFDGVCNLCNASVQFVIRRDPAHRFQFAALQSAFGTDQLRKSGLSAGMLNSVVLIEDGRIYRRSTAALRIARKLSGAWPLMYGLIIIPAFLRNLIYDFISRNRYRFFGKRDACMVPTPGIRARFIS